MFLRAMGSHGRVLKKGGGGIQFYGDVKRLLILSKAPERVRIGGPSGLVGGENDHSQVLG